MKARNAKKEKQYIPREVITTNSDVLIGCIGVSIIILGCLSSVSEIPKEFAIGASLAGMIFAISDYITTLEKISERKVGIYAFCYVTGAFAIVAVPAILTVYKSWGDLILPYADSFSMVALGLVIVSIGNRVREARSVQIKKLYSKIDELENLKNLKRE